MNPTNKFFEGNFEYKHEKSSPIISKKVKHLGFVAGGSGIAPFLQIIRTICQDKSDNTNISLIFANNVTIFCSIFF